MSSRIQTHELIWNEERIKAFWDQNAQLPWAQETYFGFQVGYGVVRLLNKLLPLRGKRILDYGCGPGYLADHLLAAGAICTGIDSSIESVEKANQRLGGHPRWEGAFLDQQGLAIAKGPFDLIISVETLEHMLPDRLPELFRTFRQALLPTDGHLWLSTPNKERLDLAQVYCPECGATFHRFQHQAAYDSESLSVLVKNNGFNTRVVGATNFARFQPPPKATLLDWNLRLILQRSLVGLDVLAEAVGIHPARTRRFFPMIRVGQGPHLFLLGNPEIEYKN